MKGSPSPAGYTFVGRTKHFLWWHGLVEVDIYIKGSFIVKPPKGHDDDDDWKKDDGKKNDGDRKKGDDRRD